MQRIAAELARFRMKVIWSWHGWRAAWSSERSLRQWAWAQAISVALALVLPLSPGERALVIALGFAVLAAELGNTAIETIVDRISPGSSEMARKAKDCGSAMVMVTALAAGSAWVTVLIGLAGALRRGG